MKKFLVFGFILLLSQQAVSAPGVDAVLSENSKNAPPLLVHVKPAYPESALALGEKGSCSVIFDINYDEGRVEHAKISECDPRGVFEESCLSAVRKWWFRPPSTLGKNVVSKSLSAICSYH